MRKSRFTDEFKAEAIKQKTERGHKVVDVAQRLGISDKSLYRWLRQSNEKQSMQQGKKHDQIFLIASKCSTIANGGIAISIK